jgi:rubrerythrin
LSSEYTAELYVHAIAIENEAARRYGELARAMAARGNHAVAALFSVLAAHESRHLDELRRRSAGLPLPPLDADYSWRDGEAPETVSLDADTPVPQHKALSLALEAEQRARAFFENASRVCEDAETRALAREMAAEEAEHVALIERMMHAADRPADWRSAA